MLYPLDDVGVGSSSVGSTFIDLDGRKWRCGNKKFRDEAIEYAGLFRLWNRTRREYLAPNLKFDLVSNLYSTWVGFCGITIGFFGTDEACLYLQMMYCSRPL